MAPPCWNGCWAQSLYSIPRSRSGENWRQVSPAYLAVERRHLASNMRAHARARAYCSPMPLTVRSAPALLS